MYAEFGSKQQLFEATLDYYNNNHLTRVLSPLEQPDANLDNIKQAFYGYAMASEGPFHGLGCLMCNTTVERGALAPESGRYIDAYLERLTNAFAHVLNNAQQNGEINHDVDLDDMAGFLTISLIAMAASVRAKAPPTQLWATYRIITKTVEQISTTK